MIISILKNGFTAINLQSHYLHWRPNLGDDLRIWMKFQSENSKIAVILIVQLMKNISQK